LRRLRLKFWSNLALFSEQDDQENDQQDETADTDIHRFAPTVFWCGEVTIPAFAKFR
jgi:hypothetical protein